MRRDLEELLDARVELSKADLDVGDLVTIFVRFFDGEGEEATILHGEEYKVEVVQSGFVPVLSPVVAFIRAEHRTISNQDRTRWKLNAVGMVNWYYYKRNASDWPTRFWNWLRFGIGFHLSSPDMGTDTVEFGFGFNVSLWGGLLSGGLGWNLTERADRGYWMFGIDLFNVLNKAREKLTAEDYGGSGTGP
ncbi:MAG: hypothetical protein O7H41_11890 [Planctomycetota bacterium]|nr:hypothetical protein [Planctomycetota bacterium]